MRPIFEYLDYRALLREAFDERAAAAGGFTYRTLAEHLGLDTSYVYRILHERSHLPVRCQSRAIEFLGLSERAAEYFTLLLAYARERNVKARNAILENAMALRDVERRILSDGEIAYYDGWWIGAIRALVDVLGGRAHPAEIARHLAPSVPEAKVSQALELLRELGLVKRLSSGRLVPAEPHVSSGANPVKVQAIRRYQQNIFALAAESIERFPKELRDISTLTLSVDDETFHDTKGLLQECRRRIQKRVEAASRPTRVIQLAMAAFPLSIPSEAKS